MPHEPTEPTLALATLTATAPRQLVDDAHTLDDEQLLEILKGFHARTTVVAAVCAGATLALTVALTPVAWFAAFALMPAAVGGFFVSNRAVQHAAAARYGVTPRCLRRVELAFDRVSRKLDVRTLKVPDWVRTDWPRTVPLVRAELERSGG